MKTELISNYQDYKDYEQMDAIDALITTLEKRKKEEELRERRKSIWQESTDKVVGLFQGFFSNKPVSKENTLIDEVITNLQQLKYSEHYQEEGETANTHLELLGILGSTFKVLPEQSELKELFNYVMFHEGSIHFSMRESSMIEPSPIDMFSEEEDYEERELWIPPYLHELLTRKILPHDIFAVTEENPLTLESDIEEHVRWAFHHIYNYYYPEYYQYTYETPPEIARIHHGIQHVSRAALYAKVFANLYRKYGDEEAKNLTEEDLKLIQIALIFHDSAREDENEDHWDHESAIFLYNYLTAVLGVDAAKAKFIAEATANKDPSVRGYYELIVNEEGELSWQCIKNEDGNIRPKNIFQKIIHDCDCLDIIRARNQYNATYLDFFQEIAHKPENKMALEEMDQLITEARSLIYTQGDSRISLDIGVKKHYEGWDAYSRIKADVSPENHPIIFALHEHLLPVGELKSRQLIDFTPYDPLQEMSGNNLKAALREGYILARGIALPSAEPIARENKPIDSDTSFAEKEIRKSMRAALINVKGRKSEPSPKEKNPMRSTSILGHGSGVYSPAGMLIFNPNTAQISKISTEDFNSGRGNKKRLAYLQYKEYEQSSAIRQQEFQELIEKMKLGLFGNAHELGSNYPEILYNITKYDAIFYTQDPTIANKICHNSYNFAHPYSPLLQAIYLQKQYERQYESTKEEFLRQHGEVEGMALFLERFGPNKSLPIYEYSGQNNSLKAIDPAEITKERIIEMWTSMCTDFMREHLGHSETESIFEMSIDDIKTLGMYLETGTSLSRNNQPGDLSYPEELRSKISECIEKERESLRVEYEESLLERFNNNELHVFSQEYFINLQYSPKLQEASATKIKEELLEFIQAMSEQTSTNDLAFSGIYDFIQLEHLDKIPPKLLTGNKLLQAYFLCQQFGLNEKSLIISQKITELARELTSQWQTHEYYDLERAHNLKALLLLVGADKEAIQEVDELLLELIKGKAEKVITENRGMHSFYIDMDNLAKANLMCPEYLEVIKAVYDKLREKAVELDEDDFICVLGLASVLKESPEQEFNEWLHKCQKKFYASSITLINALKHVITFDDSNLPLFKELVEKIHTYDVPGDKLVSYSYWSGRMEALKTVVANNEFSEEQRNIINERYQQIVADELKYYMSRYSYDDKRNRLIVLVDLVKECSGLKPNFLYFPPKLLDLFNQALNEINQDNADIFQLKEWDIVTIKKLHQQLPEPGKRLEAMDKLDSLLLSMKKDKGNKEEIVQSQRRLT